MKQKRKELIETAIKLFADKGFQATSVQDIVSSYGISKGAFYNYFSSKEELLIDIFKHYHEKLNNKILEIDSLSITSREKYKNRIQLQFKYFMKHRDFIVMYFREQNQSINEELRNLLNEHAFRMLEKEEALLMDSYGEDLRPYISDLVLICMGIRNAYMKITVFDGVVLDPDRMASFIMERIDDIVEGLKKGGKDPLLSKGQFTKYTSSLMTNRQIVLENLSAMKDTLESLDIAEGKREELRNVIHYLMEENNKKEIKKYIFQGMLANFKPIEQLDSYRIEIAKALDIELL
ncbi:TetR/AcrR family transcriptional regulator [Bacillus sp. FJAT-49736]|uniref:TetR/AcrR family transcriptional regulator n=1 Tax=Bacillus sp. FJAT-49736 TaxID=2833582 RepID=UPI001BC8D729|nr:TetR/AcrR family transcriptional regulator [Bacillus sp. FJAT-49736]MBS4173986.1 TetR/AcrR family transcriptional regulator [Bacillus sp. FJAT-49736]